jgi:hypothetical protein
MSFHSGHIRRVGMNEIVVNYLLYQPPRIGFAISQLSDGKNLIRITASNRWVDFPNTIIVDRQEILSKYTYFTDKYNRMCVCIPLKDFGLYTKDVCKRCSGPIDRSLVPQYYMLCESCEKRYEN